MRQMLIRSVGATRDGDARNSNAATQVHSAAAHIGFARSSIVLANAVALDTGICPISLRNRRPEFLRNIDATRRHGIRLPRLT